MLVYADLDTGEEIIKPNCLVMRVEKKVVSLSVPRNLNTSCKGPASCNGDSGRNTPRRRKSGPVGSYLRKLEDSALPSLIVLCCEILR